MSDQQRARIVFFGTPAYAVPTLHRLAGTDRFEVALVVTQPDRAGGRGHRTIAPPVKEAALDLGLPLIQPPTLRDEDVRDQLRAIEADCFVVAAYGLIFSQAVLDIPRHGCVNLHASILPHYRGAAPIPAAILNGDSETGVTLMVMERGLDSGPTIDIARTPISDGDTTESLTARLAGIGADLAVATLPRFLAGEISPVPQPAGASAVRQLVKADGQIDWRQPAAVIERQVRAMWPWPRAFTTIGERVLQIHRAAVGPVIAGLHPGAVRIEGGEPMIATGYGGSIIVRTGQVAGGKPQSGADLVRGRVLAEGDVCTTADAGLPPLIRPID